MSKILAVDKDIEVSKKQAAEWDKYSIGIQRVDTMHDALVSLVGENTYFFIAINEDTTPDFLTQLPILRESTNTPIFVITSNYSFEKRVKALQQGADIYDFFSERAKDNVVAAIELVNVQRRWAAQTAEQLTLLICGNIVISQLHSRVFVKDKEIILTKKEFEILRYFMNNQNVLLSYSQIFDCLWGIDFDNGSHNILWTHVRRLRQKIISVSSNFDNPIINVRGVGYRFAV